MRRSPPRRTRCWSRPPRRWRTWASTSTAAAGPVAHDEHTGEYLLLADRWHTCFFDLSGEQGLLGQVEGRTADDAAYWLAQAAPAWRDAVRVVAIDMRSIYASAVRRMLPGAQIAVDLFHVVHLAVKMTGDVRRRMVRGKYGRRGRSGDPEYGIKNLLVRNLEHLSPAQFAKVRDILGSDPAGQEIAAAWIAKEKLRHALNLRARITGSISCERDVRGRLFAFYNWCARTTTSPRPPWPGGTPAGGGSSRPFLTPAPCSAPARPQPGPLRRPAHRPVRDADAHPGRAVVRPARPRPGRHYRPPRRPALVHRQDRGRLRGHVTVRGPPNRNTASANVGSARLTCGQPSPQPSYAQVSPKREDLTRIGGQPA